MYLAQIIFTSSGRVAVNIITCLSEGVCINTSWMDWREPRDHDVSKGRTERVDLQITLIHDEELEILQRNGLLTHQSSNTTRSADQDITTAL